MKSPQIYNTLTAQEETFRPIEEGQVKMYVCGITPYDESHLGHARCYVFFDTARRFLRASGWEVNYVQNFTDIDDKIIARANTLNSTAESVSNRYIADYFKQMDLLNVLRADSYPRVSGYIPPIVRWIEKLLDRGFAYVLDDGVYYSVTKFSGYGKLSKRALSEMRAGARVEVDEKKKDPMDFALWKKAKAGEPSWDSPWGPGRPGWHIECSVMSMEILGETFDIHGGGQDLIFPHHENEICQSEGATGKPFAKLWIHNGFVTINRGKMSKSLGNFFTLREIFEKVPPEVVRFFLLSRHYRTPLDFSDDLLVQAQNSYHTLKEISEITAFLLEEDGTKPPRADELLADWREKFMEAMRDDLNTEKAIAVIFQLRSEMVEKINRRELGWLRRAHATLHHLLNDLLGISLKSELTTDTIKLLKEKLAQREICRKNKDWITADQIRKEVSALGFSIEDTPAGSLAKPEMLPKIGGVPK